jgi:hypothetical protein
MLGEDQGLRPNVQRALVKLTEIELPKKGRLAIDATTTFDKRPPAFVVYRPELKLVIDRPTWVAMGQGMNGPRFVGTHELIHIVIHDHFAMGFNGSAEEFAKVYGEEQSAEWQANTGALFFLISDQEIWERHSDIEISIDCGVDLDRVRQRLELFEKMNKIRYSEWRSRCLGYRNWEIL